MERCFSEPSALRAEGIRKWPVAVNGRLKCLYLPKLLALDTNGLLSRIYVFLLVAIDDEHEVGRNLMKHH